MSQEIPKRVLLVGSGGREHALAWKIRQDLNGGELFIAPGNVGTSRVGENINIGSEDVDRLTAFAVDHRVGITVVGPEVPLAMGLVDSMNDAGISAFGPTQKAARLETDKAFASDFMVRHRIPSPEAHCFDTIETALNYVNSKDPKTYVIKASGLCAGKGVILPDSQKEAESAVQRMRSGELFGAAGKKIVIQERLSGPEVSVLAFTDGMRVVPLLPAQDHKRIYDGDKGPNTGGMGAYAPVPAVTPAMLEKIQKEILQKTVDGMREDGVPYKGVLYAGLMLTNKGPKVLEYNVRFGDPETQPLMLLLKSDLLPILLASINGTLRQSAVEFRDGFAVCVVLAANGYPEKPVKGQVIEGIDVLSENSNLMVFQAGTLIKDGRLVTNGGRVLGVTAYGTSMPEALNQAYSAIGPNGVCFPGMQYRKDIGLKAYGS